MTAEIVLGVFIPGSKVQGKLETWLTENHPEMSFSGVAITFTGSADFRTATDNHIKATDENIVGILVSRTNLDIETIQKIEALTHTKKLKYFVMD